MNCKNCGAPLSPGRNTCEYCGSPHSTLSGDSFDIDYISPLVMNSVMTPNEACDVLSTTLYANDKPILTIPRRYD